MASQCKRQQCTIDRRGFRQELDSWRHKLIHCVGFESIIEGLFGPELVEDLKLCKDFEPTAVTDWSFDENCLFCCLRRDKVKEHLIGLGHEGLEDTPKPLQVRDQTTISRLEKQAEEFLHAVLSRKDVPNFSDPHIPVVAREILQRMIKQFAAEYTSKSSSSQDTCSDSQPLSDQSLPTPPLIPGASPCTSPAPTVAGPAHSQNPVLSKLLMADQDAPLDLTIKKPLAVPSDQDGVLDLSIKKNRYSSGLPVRSPCLSPATPTIKGESSDFRISKAKDLQSSSTLEQFMAKLCRHHQRQIVDAIGFLQTEVKALASSSPHQDSISTSGIQGTICSMTSSVTPEKSLGDLRLPSEFTPKSEVQDMSHSIRGSCATTNVPEKVASLKTSIAASPTLDPCSSGLGSNPASITPNANLVDSENKHHSDHAPLRLKIMKSNAAAGKRLSCVLNSSLSPLSDTPEDRECSSDVHNRTETHSARLSSSNKRHSQSSNIHQARQKETLRHAKDSPTKLYSVHMTIPPDSPRTARKTIRASPEHQIRDSAYKTMVDPDLGHCDIVFIDKPITECFKKRHSGMVPRRNARKSTRGHMYLDEVWELKTVRTLAGRGNCPNPMPELITLVTPKQVLSKPEGVPPVDMPFAGACTETMIQQMSTEQSDESVIPGTEDTVEVAASEVDIVVETSQTGQSQNMGHPVLQSLERLPSESTETDFNTDVEDHMPAVSGTTTGCEESFGQVASEAEKDVVPEPKEDIDENTKQMVAETVIEKIEPTIAKEAQPRLSLGESRTSESIVEQISITEPVHQVEEETETEERNIVKARDEQPKGMQQETHSADTEVTEKLVTQTHNENTLERPETQTQNMDTEVAEQLETQTHDDQTEVQEKQTHSHGTEVLEKPEAQSHNDKTEVLEKPETPLHKDTAEDVEKSDLQECFDIPEVGEKLEKQIHSEDTEFTEKSDTQTHSDNTEGTEKPVTLGSVKELMTGKPDIKTSEAVDSVVSETEGGDEIVSGLDLSSKTLDSLLNELPPWRRKKGSVVSLPKRLQHTEDVVIGYVNGRPVSASDRSLRRRSGSSISPNQTPAKAKSSNKKNLVDPISGLAAEDKNDEKQQPETPEKCIEMSPVTDQVKEPSSTSSPTSETPSKLKQTNKQKKPHKGQDSVLVCSDQLDGQSQRQLRSASQKPVESQTAPSTSNDDSSISMLELTTIACTPSSTENPTQVPHSSPASISAPQVRSVNQKPVESQASTATANNDPSISMPKLAATTHSPSTENLTLVPHSSAASFSAPQVSSPPSSEQSQENNEQETTVELNTENILLEITAFKDVQKDHLDDGSEHNEQSQENKDQETTVELNTEKIQQEVTAFKDAQTHNIEDKSQARQKLRSAMVVEEGNKEQHINSEESSPLEKESPLKDEISSAKTVIEEKKENLQLGGKSSLLENQSPAKAEMPSQSITVKSRRVHRTEVEALKMDPKVATLEDWSASGDDSSSDRPTRMPLRSERSKIAASQQPTPQTPEDSKKLALRSQRLASPSTCAVTVAEKHSDVASPGRIMPERITKGPEKSPPVPVTPDLPHRSSIPVTTRHEPSKQANKFLETLNGEENQHLISNLNLKYDKMQRGWVQMDKDGQPVIKHKNKADRQAAIWKSKRRTKKPKSLEHQRYSPVQMLFMKGFNLTSICRWFLESTETKSLVIVKKVNTRLPSETQLCFHSSSSVSGTSQGVFPSLQAERLKKHLKKFAIASPVKSNPKSQKLIAKALEQEAIIVKGKEKRELPSTGPTMMKSKASAAATVQISESQKSSGKSKNPASARILRKYSNIREKMQVQQTNERLSKASKTLNNNNLKRLTPSKPTAKSLLRPSQKAQKSQQPICKQMKESAAKIEKRKILSAKKAKKQLVQDKADKKPTKQLVQDKVDKKHTKQPTKDKTDKNPTKPTVQDKADTTSKQPVQDKVDVGTTKQPVPDKVDKKPTKQPVQDKADKKPTKQPAQDKIDKRPTKQPIQDKIDKKPTRQPVQDKMDKKPTKKSVQDKDKTTKQPAQEKADKKPAKQNVQEKADTTSKASAKDKVDKKPTKQPAQEQTEKSSKQSVQEKAIKATKQLVQDEADQNTTEQPVQDKQADRHPLKQPVQDKQADRHPLKQPVQDDADISSKQPVQDKQDDQSTKQLVQDQVDKQNTKQPVQEKVVKTVKASKDTIRKELPKRSSLRLASPKMPDHNVVKTPEVDGKMQMETERAKLEHPTVSKTNAAKTQTSEPSQGAVVESKMTEGTVPELPDQVLTRSQRKMETVAPASGSTSPALKRNSKSMTQTQSKSQTASPKLVKKADKPSVTRSGAVKSPPKRSRPASPPRSSTKTSAKKTQQLSEAPAKRTRTR